MKTYHQPNRFYQGADSEVMMGWLVWEINLSNGWQIYWTWPFMRISFQQILLEHAPKGKLLYHHGICEPLQLWMKFLESSTKINVTPLRTPFPQQCHRSLLPGMAMEIIYSRDPKATTKLEAPFPKLGGERGCPGASFVGASNFPLGPFSRSPVRIWQHGPCPARHSLLCLP